MSLSLPNRELLRDLLEWTLRAQRFIAGMSEDEFLRDERTQSAVLYTLTVIGEIAARVSEDTRTGLPAVPWHEIRGMRNRIAHDYVGVDIDVVWRTVSVDLPRLAQVIQDQLAPS